MSSYLSQILTTTSTRYAHLRRTLLPSDDASDGDSPDDTHIARVLRAYYIEKGRPFPPWLPADPKAPQPAAPQFSSPQFTARGAQAVGGGVGAYGGQGRGRGRGLSELWDSPGGASSQDEVGGAEKLSLRRGVARAGVGAGRGNEGYHVGNQGRRVDDAESTQQQQRTTAEGRGGGARPLPSQRAGSYQSKFVQETGIRNASDASSASGRSAGTSAQERLKARLLGGGGGGGGSQRGLYERGNSYGHDGDGAGSAYEGSAGGGGYGDAGRKGGLFGRGLR